MARYAKLAVDFYVSTVVLTLDVTANKHSHDGASDDTMIYLTKVTSSAKAAEEHIEARTCFLCLSFGMMYHTQRRTLR